MLFYGVTIQIKTPWQTFFMVLFISYGFVKKKKLEITWGKICLIDFFLEHK